MEYLPQRLAKELHSLYGDYVWAYIKEMYKLKFPLFANGINGWEKDDFEKFILSGDFFNPKYNGQFAMINSDLIMLNAEKLHDTTTSAELATIITDSKDLIISSLLLGDWAEHKNVYKPDKDFVNMLISTPNFKLHIDQLKALPYQDICFDFSACPDLAPVEIGFLSFRFVGDSIFIVNYLMNSKLNIFSFYYGAKIDAGYINLSEMSLDNMLPAADEYKISQEFAFGSEAVRYDYKYTRRAIANIMLQLIGYITCQNAEVKQSVQSKKTHKNHPASYKPKDDISEFTEYDIGIRIGKTIRKYTEQNKNITEDSESAEHSKTGSRAGGTKAPHIRGAHWHHYWTGEGRTELIVKWLPPTFINKDKPSKDIIIHKVK